LKSSIKKPSLDKGIVVTTIKELYELHPEGLTDAVVLEAAKDPINPLHTHGGFDWDLKRAAEEHWLHHARSLIHMVRSEVRIHNTQTTVGSLVVVSHRPTVHQHVEDVIDTQLWVKEQITRIEKQAFSVLGQAKLMGEEDFYKAEFSQMAERITS